MSLLRSMAVGVVLSVLGVGSANAGLINVSEIEIRSAIPSYLQITEVVAKETNTGLDLALTSAGATTSSHSVGWGGLESYAVNGIGPNGHWDTAGEYHSAGSTSIEFLKIFLSSPAELDEITIFGRTDCCDNRDFYDLYVWDNSHNLIFSAMDLSAYNPGHLVSASFTVPEPASIALMGLGLVGLGFARRKKAV